MENGIVKCPLIPAHIPIPDVDFGSVLFDGIRNHSADALIDAWTGVHVTRRDLLQKSEQLARNLLSLGCRRGDVVAIFSPNSIEWVLVAVSALYIGAVPAGINSLLTSHEVTHLLKLCRPLIIFVDESLLTISMEAIESLDIHTNIKIIVNGDFAPASCILLKTLLVKKPINDGQDLSRHISSRPKPHDPCLIMFSSGTTGMQKAVLLSHRCIIAEYLVATNPKTAFVLSHPIAYAPFSHVAGMWMILFGLAAGRTVHIMSRFDLKIFLTILKTNQISDLFLVPTVTLMLLKSPDVQKYGIKINSLICGAAPLGAEVEDQLRIRFPGIVIRQAYGLTESSGICCILPYDTLRSNTKSGTVGVPVFNTEMKVVDIVTKSTLGPNNAGEIFVRGPLVMSCYLNNAKSTAETLHEDGWLSTGDVGYCDEDGYFFITDRIKELIKYNAYQVAPAELEAVLLLHPDVEEAAVFGIPHETAGEMPMACVVIKSGGTVSEHDIQRFVDAKVAPYKKLRGGVRFVSAIPKTGSGKILRRDVRKALFDGKL